MFNKLAVYAVAHQDDWQLFMDPNVSADLLDPGCKTVIIHTTAGDGGNDLDYWQAREEGSLSSLVFRFSGNPSVGASKKYVEVGGKKIYLMDISTCSFYFLRLPDGGMQGDGFGLYDFQSLSKIRQQRIGQITTVDGMNTFSAFGEISHLIDGIVERELGLTGIDDPGKISLNFPEYDSALNPNDHSDHLNTALVLQGTSVYHSTKKYAYVHYDIQHSAPDLSGTSLFWKVGMFCVYHQTVMNMHGHSTISETPEYNVWSKKDAIRREVV